MECAQPQHLCTYPVLLPMPTWLPAGCRHLQARWHHSAAEKPYTQFVSGPCCRLQQTVGQHAAAAAAGAAAVAAGEVVRKHEWAVEGQLQGHETACPMQLGSLPMPVAAAGHAAEVDAAVDAASAQLLDEFAVPVHSHDDAEHVPEGAQLVEGHEVWQHIAGTLLEAHPHKHHCWAASAAAAVGAAAVAAAAVVGLPQRLMLQRQ